MKRAPIITVLFFLMAFAVQAQKPPIKFGDVSMEELKMMHYEKDSSAVAVVLADYGESSISYDQSKGFRLKFERLRRVKILSKGGYEWGDFSIPLYTDGLAEEDVISLKAVTYNLENGKIVESKLKNDAIYREAVDIYQKNVKFALANVKEGSVIDISYKISSPFFYYFRNWDFQATIPIIWSEYRVRIPEYFSYKKNFQGYLGVSINESEPQDKFFNLEYKQRRDNDGSVAKVDYQKIDYVEDYSRWVVKDAPAFKIEPKMTSYHDYISRVNFELSTIQLPERPMQSFSESWEDLTHDFLANSHFGGVIKGSEFLQEHTEKAIGGKTDAKSKTEAIYHYVKEHIGWNGQYRIFSEENLKKIVDAKKGSSAEINLTLVSMLQKAGLNASPVLISTRDHGFVRKENAIAAQFNYVIAAVESEGSYQLLDATDRSLPISLLPERCLNGEGYLVAEGKSGWVKISPLKSRYSVSSDFNLSPEGELKGKLLFTHDGYYAQRMRLEFAEKGKEGYLKNMTGTRNWEITSSTFENLEKLREPVKEAHEIQINDQIQVNGDHMYLNPLLVFRTMENPFQSEKRQYPVDFGSPEENLYMTRIAIPKGWMVEETPKPQALVLPGNSAKFVYNISQMGNIISLTCQLVVSKPLFSQDEYLTLRDFYSQVIAKQAEVIVLKKE